MKKFLNRFQVIVSMLVNSIAFYPTLIFIGFLILGFTMVSYEDDKMTEFLADKASFLVISNADNARAILTTLIGGILSLTVFSFSMVMILLNQASSNFSPRLLPGLISDKKNQFVLGFYLGTIAFNIIVLIGIIPTENAYTQNGFSVLIAIIFGVICLGLFVFFIHAMSSNIQINNILKGIFVETSNRLESLIKEERKQYDDFPTDTSNWHIIKTYEAGYFFGVNEGRLLQFANDMESNLLVLPYKGKYLLPHMPIIKTKQELTEEQVSDLRELIQFSVSRNTDENYVLGLKQITEVGLKAMSPGINDPGTCIMTIDYITQLLALRMKLDDREFFSKEDQDYKIELYTVSFEDLLQEAMAAYRQYCKHDVIIMQKLIFMLKYLRRMETKVEDYYNVIDHQLEIIREDYQENIENSHDLKRLDILFEK